MGFTDSIIGRDIVLDEAAFDTAISEFAELSMDLQNLRDRIQEMLDVLKRGFNTPAGVKFINSCETNLFTPLDDQKIVLEHISNTLQESKQAYSTVFREYEELQNKINQISN